MASHEHDSVAWLGYSIDLSHSPVMDLHAASLAVLRTQRILPFNRFEDLYEVEINGVVYSVPRAVTISLNPISQRNFLSYSTGGDARRAFRADPGLLTRHFAVTGGSDTIVFSQERVFTDVNQYALYIVNNYNHAARLTDYFDLINEGLLLLIVEDLPPQFDGEDDRILEEYHDFFRRVGSHVLVDVNYGARFQLNAWASNANPSVNANFVTNVHAFFNGVTNGGEYDRGVKSEPQYDVFLQSFQRLVTVVGGDPQLSAALTSNPTDWTNYQRWSETTSRGTPVYTSFHTTPIWSLMSFTLNDVLRRYAGELSRAFTWILNHPRIYRTAVIFDIQSDWGEFNLLTPNAVIHPDDRDPFPPETVASVTRVQWGKEHSHEYEMVTLRLFVVNDGNPIDFSISRGSNGAAPREGRAEALIEGRSYVNDRITDGVWNTAWFFGAPVSRIPESFRLQTQGSGAEYSWNDVLEGYLSAARTGV